MAGNPDSFFNLIGTRCRNILAGSSVSDPQQLVDMGRERFGMFKFVGTRTIERIAAALKLSGYIDSIGRFMKT